MVSLVPSAYSKLSLERKGKGVVGVVRLLNPADPNFQVVEYTSRISSDLRKFMVHVDGTAHPTILGPTHEWERDRLRAGQTERERANRSKKFK